MPFRFVPILIATLTLMGCASSRVDLVPLPATDGAVRVSENGAAHLQVRVQNQGVEPATSSPVTVKFFLSNLVLTTPLQDGGPLAAGESSAILKFDIPEDCVEGGCSFQVYVDPHKDLKSENRSNNLVRGHCQGTSITAGEAASEKLEPGVQ